MPLLVGRHFSSLNWIGLCEYCEPRSKLWFEKDLRNCAENAVPYNMQHAKDIKGRQTNYSFAESIREYLPFTIRKMLNRYFDFCEAAMTQKPDTTARRGL